MVFDGGYEPPKERVRWAKKAHVKDLKTVRGVTVTVEDVGKPFDKYVEDALTAYNEWRKTNNKRWYEPIHEVL